MKSNFKDVLAKLQQDRFAALQLNTTSFNQNLPCAYYVTEDRKTLVLNIEGAGEFLDVAAAYIKRHSFGSHFGRFAGLTEKLPTKIEMLLDQPERIELNGALFYARPNGQRYVYTVHIAAHTKQSVKQAKIIC